MKSLKRWPIEDACRESGIEDSVIRYYVKMEWIVPADPSTPGFDEEDIARARLIRELQADFGVNDEAVPVILHLLDQLHSLRSLIKRAS